MDVPAVLVASPLADEVVGVASAMEGLVAEPDLEMVLHCENTSWSYVSVVSGQYLERQLISIRFLFFGWKTRKGYLVNLLFFCIVIFAVAFIATVVASLPGCGCSHAAEE